MLIWMGQLGDEEETALMEMSDVRFKITPDHLDQAFNFRNVLE